MRDLMKERASWEGTSSELLAELKGMVDDDAKRSRAFPKDPTRLAGQLRRMVVPLLTEGIRIGFGRSGQSRGVRIDRSDTASLTDRIRSAHANKEVF